MSKLVKLHVFEDPGHGWARIAKSRLVKLGIADKISSYSYQRGAMAFLEEDCDLTLLVTTLRSRGYEVKFTSSHTNRQSKIRIYETYKV